jgi:hypothetical protein
VYEILYEDDRDVDVDKLTDAEVAALEKEFDAMDTLKQGYLSRFEWKKTISPSLVRSFHFSLLVLDRDGLVAYFSALAAPVEVSKVLGGREKRQDRTAKKIDPAMLALVNEQVSSIIFCLSRFKNCWFDLCVQVDSIMAMDVSGGGSRVELHEYARSQASTIVLSRASARKRFFLCVFFLLLFHLIFLFSTRGKRLSVRISGAGK